MTYSCGAMTHSCGANTQSCGYKIVELRLCCGPKTSCCEAKTWIVAELNSSFVMLKFQDSILTLESKVVQNQILHWVKPCTDVIGGKESVK